MEYNRKKMLTDLKRLSKELQGHEKAQIAGSEQVSLVTVQNYLNGKVTVPSLAKAIIDRANAIIKNRD